MKNWSFMLKKAVSILFLLVINFSVSAKDYMIGTYYYPGWKDKQIYNANWIPWDVIKPYPEREPLLSWYPEGTDSVTTQHLDWMYQYGIDFVVYDWYWAGSQKPSYFTGDVYLEHALNSYKRSASRNKVKYSILWANQPATKADFQGAVGYWVKNYFNNPEYLRFDNKPVVFIFFAGQLEDAAKKFGSTGKELLDLAQSIAVSAGLPGIHFVAGTGAYTPMISADAKNAGYSSFSYYNMHNGVKDTSKQSFSYAELDADYREHWNKFATSGNLPLIVPMTAGWNKKPWGGSSNPLHDNSMSDPSTGEFETHLLAARDFMDKNSNVMFQNNTPSKIGVICCWNEFGEGSIIEPTKKYGFSHLEKIKKVFGAP